MTDQRHHASQVEAHGIMRAFRHVARGKSPEPVLSVAPAAVRVWVRTHPELFLRLVECERREIEAQAHA